ncbi:ComEC/Rec2 family competence protein [Plesiomonas shigelloides]|uniref:ComEC/Rec2 family competence protein n=1 Tax=Plesiomonas shigelloides TaxID=703 RepID=UPI00057ABFC1|nr:hypothetical protein [Plesiomonas shigelloides]
MAYEVDFLGVGEESKSGDAIAIRFGNLTGPREEQTIVVIDGGFAKDGDALVEHIKKHYETDVVDVLISTHPDQDHINGLFPVIENLDVKRLWIHKPWDNPYGLANLFKDGRVTDNSISARLKDSLEAAYRLVKLAEDKGILIQEPFTGLSYKDVKVLGPSEEYYTNLLTQLNGMPAAKNIDESMFDKVRGGLEQFIEKTIKVVRAVWGEDKLDNEDGTSAKNNMSVITQIIVDGKRLVFTGDAGITALNAAADEIDRCQSNATLSFFQVPHHGSRRNVGPNVLNRILGEPVSKGSARNITAIASTAKLGEPKHAHKAVLNAFTHRGVKVLSTRGRGICHVSGIPLRQGWNTLEAEQYHTEYDDEQ